MSPAMFIYGFKPYFEGQQPTGETQNELPLYAWAKVWKPIKSLTPMLCIQMANGNDSYTEASFETTDFKAKAPSMLAPRLSVCKGAEFGTNGLLPHRPRHAPVRGHERVRRHGRQGHRPDPHGRPHPVQGQDRREAEILREGCRPHSRLRWRLRWRRPGRSLLEQLPDALESIPESMSAECLARRQQA